MILTVAGGKGGVGKSTVAYNLGAVLGADAGRGGGQGAVVVDADLSMANLPAGRGPDLHDVLAGRACPLEAVRHGPVSLLPCGRSLAGARAADVAGLDDTVRAVEREYGDVIIDCPAGMRADAGVPLAVADACLLVTTPDPFAVSDAVRTRELARELDCGLVQIVLNRASGVEQSTVDTFARLLGGPVTPLPTHPALGQSVETGIPVTQAHTVGDVVTPVTELAAAVENVRR